MQIWMGAMLAVSAVLILRDMAKLVFTGRKKGRPVYDVYPQKEKIDRYARSLQKLAHTFYEMPGRQEQLSQAEVQDMFVQVQQRVCVECNRQEKCWIRVPASRCLRCCRSSRRATPTVFCGHRVNGWGSVRRRFGLRRNCNGSFLRPERNCCIETV